MPGARAHAPIHPLRHIADAVAGPGWCVAESFVEPELAAALAAQAWAAWLTGAFRAAGTGAGTTPAIRPSVRGDHLLWWDTSQGSSAQLACLDRFEALRLTLNRELQLGLLDFECHFAVYPAGARYGRHLDRFKTDARRTLSCVLYLNADWREDDGGQLRLHLDESHSVDVMPRAGTLVTFLSERFEHEVLPATRERLSLAGWFRRRG
jgi:SM-20-related protein